MNAPADSTTSALASWPNHTHAHGHSGRHRNDSDSGEVTDFSSKPFGNKNHSHDNSSHERFYLKGNLTNLLRGKPTPASSAGKPGSKSDDHNRKGGKGKRAAFKKQGQETASEQPRPTDGAKIKSASKRPGGSDRGKREDRGHLYETLLEHS